LRISAISIHAARKSAKPLREFAVDFRRDRR
jgi:hypothetical protein